MATFSIKRVTISAPVLLAFSIIVFFMSVHKTDIGRTLFLGKPRTDVISAFEMICGAIQEVNGMLREGEMTLSSVFHLGTERAWKACF